MQLSYAIRLLYVVQLGVFYKVNVRPIVVNVMVVAGVDTESSQVAQLSGKIKFRIEF
jgi:hypothetical protein